jgi:hypothetical protein
MEQEYLESLKNSTPKMQDFKGYIDADDELQPIAEKIKFSSKYLTDVDVSRIKFFYTNKPKKSGGNYSIFNLLLRNEVERSIEGAYDYVVTVYSKVWEQLTPIQKVISLDKALCGIDYGNGEEIKLGKASPDCSEFKSNMKQYGAKEVMDTSEIISMTCSRIIEEIKEEKKAKAAAKKEGKKQNREVESA